MNKNNIFGITLIALVGLIIILLAIRSGIGTSPDFVVYTGGARSINLNMGLSMTTVGGDAEPITYYAPFYPLLLSLSGLLHMDPVTGARWINSLLFGSNNLVVGTVLLSVSIENEVNIFWIPIVGSLFCSLLQPC